MSSPRSPKKRIDELSAELLRHDRLYYGEAAPEISDTEYDAMLRELQALEETHPHLRLPDSPTQRVGGAPTKTFPEAIHPAPMLSLANAYSEEELRDFDRRIGALVEPPVAYSCELKFDGVSLSLIYRGGVLERGATRGDGNRGDDITANVRTIRSIPLRLREVPEGVADCEVRGEVLMTRTDFEALNEERGRAGEKTFVNPRNFTSGTLKLQDSRIVASRRLRFYAYSIDLHAGNRRARTVGGATSPGGPSPGRAASQFGSLGLLRTLGFATDEHARRYDDIGGVIAHWQEWERRRPELPYDVDGIVVKLDSVAAQARAGAVARSPRWALACKFSARAAETVLTDIVVQIGRMGTATPVAVLEPVFIGGTTVTRASLYNADYIAETDIRIGDLVRVERGGDVIPKVTAARLRPGKKRRGRKFRFPASCPACGSPLVRSGGEANHFCDNGSCPDQVRGRIMHWASRTAMDLPGLGEANVDQLVDAGLIGDAADLYYLAEKRDRLLELERWAPKSVDNLLAGIADSKKRAYAKVLYGLGIRHIGATAAELLSRYGDIDRLMSASAEDLQSISQVGPVMAGSVAAFFKMRANRKLIGRLKKAGLAMQGSAKKKNGIFGGQVFVLTGTLSMTRDEASRAIESQGGGIAGSVSKKVSVVIAGADAGSKLVKARKLGIPVWDEETFLGRLVQAK